VEDYADFYPVVEQNASFLQMLKDSNALYCIDAGEELKIRGQSSVDCNALYIDLKHCVPSKDDNCTDQTLDDLQEYLGHPELIIY
jgi:hypothetical protein